MTSTSEHRPQEPGTRPLLALATESLVSTAAERGTVVDVVHGRALRPYREGLRQYLALRLGSIEEADAVLRRLRAVVAAQGADALLAPPGIRARLYRHARRLAAQRQDEVGLPTPEALAALPWRWRRDGSGPEEAALIALRTGLGREDAELLELRHARELSPEDIAFVLDRPVEDVLEALEGATRRALATLHGRGRSVPGLRRALLEAFALESGARNATAAVPDDAPGGLATGTVIGGRYAIETRVGTGAFGDVYRAKDTEVPGHVVALKLLHQTARSEAARTTALRELHLIASVFHPSVVQFKDHGWYEGRLWFVMPWYEGETLESRMARGPLGRAEARRIFEPLARALATMHEAGIRHQDVKPDNIFLARIRGFGGDRDDEDVLPVLLDLGVAAKDAEMVVAGTPTYFAPEVARQFSTDGHKPKVTAAADVFALALSLRNCLEPHTQPDVPAGAVESFIAERATTQPPLPRSRELKFLAPHFDGWMSLDPDERPTADELAEELAVLTRPEERRARRWKILRWVVPATVVLGALFVSVVYLLSARAERQRLAAERARMAEAAARQDLAVEREQTRSLERDVEKVRARYERSQLSRTQLAGELAHAEQALGRSRRRLEGLEERRDALASELEEVTATLEGTRTELGERSAESERLRREAGSLRGKLERVEHALQGARTETERLAARVREQESNVATLGARLDAERAKSEKLEQELGRAMTTRTAQAAELAQTKARLRELEAVLEGTKTEHPRAGNDPSAAKDGPSSAQPPTEDGKANAPPEGAEPSAPQRPAS
jgi:archaellum component FlaC